MEEGSGTFFWNNPLKTECILTDTRRHHEIFAPDRLWITFHTFVPVAFQISHKSLP
jgi:hypothetical protein